MTASIANRISSLIEDVMADDFVERIEIAIERTEALLETRPGNPLLLGVLKVQRDWRENLVLEAGKKATKH